MAVNSALAGWNVLVTRPEGQSKRLCDLIVAAGGKAISFPTIEIVPLEIERNLNLAQYDVIIFVSRNAVKYFAERITPSIAASTLLVSVGEGSAESMRSHGVRVDLQPDRSIGSEGLLMMPELEDVSGKKVLIVRGKGGRELLAETLVQRGAEVRYIEVYERALPSHSDELCRQALTANCIVCTSAEGVNNLVLLLENNVSRLFNKPMIVMSERIKGSALLHGFNRIVVTNVTNDSEVIKAISDSD